MFGLVYPLNDWTLERYKIRRFCHAGAEDGGFIVNTRKNALKITEMSGKRAKMRYFPYIKQNPIAETRLTMESFFVAGVGFEHERGYLLHGVGYAAIVPHLLRGALCAV